MRGSVSWFKQSQTPNKRLSMNACLNPGIWMMSGRMTKKRSRALDVDSATLDANFRDCNQDSLYFDAQKSGLMPLWRGSCNLPLNL